MNMKFNNMLPIAIENVLEFVSIFSKLIQFVKLNFEYMSLIWFWSILVLSSAFSKELHYEI